MLVFILFYIPCIVVENSIFNLGSSTLSFRNLGKDLKERKDALGLEVPFLFHLFTSSFSALKLLIAEAQPRKSSCQR
jgi:hypothetical protein